LCLLSAIHARELANKQFSFVITKKHFSCHIWLTQCKSLILQY
jgi:hypothetical protein